MRKPAFCICENKDADQLLGNREADQRLGFRYIDSTIPLLPKSKISSLYPYSVIAQPGLCGTWSETPEHQFSHNEAQLIYCWICPSLSTDIFIKYTEITSGMSIMIISGKFGNFHWFASEFWTQ